VIFSITLVQQVIPQAVRPNVIVWAANQNITNDIKINEKYNHSFIYILSIWM
jgi:hypothetical protein